MFQLPKNVYSLATKLHKYTVCVYVSKWETEPSIMLHLTNHAGRTQLSLPFLCFHLFQCNTLPFSLSTEYLIVLYLHVLSLILCHFQFGSPHLNFLPFPILSLLIFRNPTSFSLFLLVLFSYIHAHAFTSSFLQTQWHPQSHPHCLCSSLSFLPPSIFVSFHFLSSASLLNDNKSLLFIWGTSETDCLL